MDFRGAPSRALVVVVVAGSLEACVGYAAPVDVRAQRGDFRLRAASVAVPEVRAAGGERNGEVRVVLDAEAAPPGAVPTGAWLTARGGRCWTGVAATQLGRTGARTAEEPIREGERLTFAFPTAAAPLGEASPTLAVLVRTPDGPARCMVVPLSEDGQPVPLAVAERFTVGLEMGLQGFAPNPGPTFQVITIPVTVGVWLGDYHVALGAGPLGAGCNEPECPVTSPEEGNVEYATGFLGLASIGRPVLRASAVELHAEVRYRFMTLPSDTHAGRQVVIAHGPTLEPIFAVVSEPLAGSKATGGSREGLIGIGAPVGYVVSDRGGGVVFGVDLRGFFTVL
jgi:hypothetical protein